MQTFLSAAELNKKLDDPNWVIIDCRFDFDDTELGYREYQAGHIPGSFYADMNKDLSSDVVPGKTGRHPLPDQKTLVERFSSWGIDGTTTVVIYDEKNGGLAARLWWLLRWLGHEKALILDGGWPAWKAEDYPVEMDESPAEARVFSPTEHPQFIVDTSQIESIRLDPDYLLIDSRGAERFWGIEETIDPVAGHIPGAMTAPYAGNLDEKGFFLTPEQLKERFENLLDDLPPDQVVFYCGSGVTACHNIAAMVAAGYEMPQLYPGSWSEWITDPSRPIEPGDSG